MAQRMSQVAALGSWLVPVVLAALGCPPAAARDAAAEARIATRVEALVGAMTLKEKIGQLNLATNRPGFDYGAVAQGDVGAIVAFTSGAEIAAVQAAARRSPSGVPLLVGLDVIHGLRTMFPLPLAEAASFDPDLARRVAESAARDAAAMGYNWAFAPDADLARDPRWGRIAEGFGEDPLMGRAFTAARVAGFRAGGLAATLKHFVGYGAAQGGRDYDAASIPASELHDSYLPPFVAGIGAGAEAVMPAFSTLNGMPSTADGALIGGILRGRLGFDGVVVSDWVAIGELVNHDVAADGAAAARTALLAGVDLDMASNLYAAHLRDEVEAGRVPAAAIDAAARRVLTMKGRIGLLDRPPRDPVSPGTAPPPNPESRALAREAARDTIVLLRNDGTLPLRDVRSVAVIGGMAQSRRDLIGPHGALVHFEDGVTLLDGIRRRAASSGVAVAAAAGCEAECRTADGFADAVAAARGADVTVVALGEPLDMTGEGASRSRLALPGRQAELLAALVETGKPVVLVLLASRPVELGPVVDRLAALMMAWFPGTEGGNALADLLFGDASPSAKLPLSWPVSVGQIPISYDRLPSGRPTEEGNRFTLHYIDAPVAPLFPFGFGLTYADVALSELKLGSARLGRGGTLAASLRLDNRGARAGREVVQLYVRQRLGSRSRPLRRLAAFAKVALEPGESRDVTLSVPVEALGFHDESGRYAVETGRYEVFVGTASDATLQAAFEVVAE